MKSEIFISNFFVMQPFMDIESSRSYIDELYSTDHQKCLEAIITLKNSVIGSNRQKGSIIAQGVVPRLLQLLCDPPEALSTKIRLESAVTLGSLAKGTDQHVLALIELGIVPSLLQVLLILPISENLKNKECKLNNLLIEACIRCLKSVFQHSSAPVFTIFQYPKLIERLLSLCFLSTVCQICVSVILKTACKTIDEQNILLKSGAINVLAIQLESSLPDVQLPALSCLANICYQNSTASALVAASDLSKDLYDKTILGRLGKLMGRDNEHLIQLEAARCVTYMHRAKAVSASDPRVIYKALPCLVRLCHKERPTRERVAAAETLAYLTEVDTSLQRLASISNHLIPTLAEYFKASAQSQDAILSQEMRQAAFRTFASLAANDEDIRKRIIETENLMDHIVSGLQDPGGSKIQLAAVRCLHSLSRSVQQLRTTFQDHVVWRHLMQLLHGIEKNNKDGKTDEDTDLLTVASGTLCNLLLEFSPSKEPILESGGVELLCSLTKRSDPALRLNGVWALMNVAFQAEQRIKLQILNCLGTDQIFRLLTDTELPVLMKTLGLLRNLVSTKAHIDCVMVDHAAHIMQAVILVLEDPVHSADVKEQALCILANVADGDRSRDHIMANEDVLKKLMDYMMHSSIKLQVAAILCVCNLVWREEPGAAQRQARLKELGIYRILLQLRHTKDTQLFDKVKTALAQFFDT